MAANENWIPSYAFTASHLLSELLGTPGSLTRIGLDHLRALPPPRAMRRVVFLTLSRDPLYDLILANYRKVGLDWCLGLRHQLAPDTPESPDTSESRDAPDDASTADST